MFICNYLLFLLLVIPAGALAAPAITCHCFTERTYNPAKPVAADPYLLAATQNSLFAAAFSVDKKTIVMKKQGGAGNDEMWVAYWLAAKGFGKAEDIMAGYESAGSWQGVIAGKADARQLGDSFVREVNGGASSARLAILVVDELLTRHRMIDNRELSALRKSGASNQEAIIAALLGLKTRKSPLSVLQSVRSGSKSWGALLGEAKLPASAMVAEFTGLLKQH